MMEPKPSTKRNTAQTPGRLSAASLRRVFVASDLSSSRSFRRTCQVLRQEAHLDVGKHFNSKPSLLSALASTLLHSSSSSVVPEQAHPTCPHAVDTAPFFFSPTSRPIMSAMEASTTCSKYSIDLISLVSKTPGRLFTTFQKPKTKFMHQHIRLRPYLMLPKSRAVHWLSERQDKPCFFTRKGAEGFQGPTLVFWALG